ncbi:glycosyltransferase [Rarobacter incanus]|nr:glycosyltransferase [Rarobacter incanus]
MRIAIKYDNVFIDPNGNIGGHETGDTLVRRLLRLFPNSIVIGQGPRKGNGFDVLPLEFIQGDDVIVVNMDVIDSVDVWRTLHANCEKPKVMNFLWWPVARYSSHIEKAALTLACALFPTFANSERTAGEAREIVSKWDAQPLAERAIIAWVNLGFRHEHVQPRRDATEPVVLYPAIYLTREKRPQLFFDVVEAVHETTPLQVEARLTESQLVSSLAMRYSRKDWIWIGPLTAGRDSYWEALSRTTAFLATAETESYGLMYVEALAAGAIGIFPNLPWAHALVPDRYPFFYDTPEQAAEMLRRAVVDPDTCLAEMDTAAGSGFQSWLRSRHDDDIFERVIVARINQWFDTAFELPQQLDV